MFRHTSFAATLLVAYASADCGGDFSSDAYIAKSAQEKSEQIWRAITDD